MRTYYIILAMVFVPIGIFVGLIKGLPVTPELWFILGLYAMIIRLEMRFK